MKMKRNREKSPDDTEQLQNNLIELEIARLRNLTNVLSEDSEPENDAETTRNSIGNKSINGHNYKVKVKKEVIEESPSINRHKVKVKKEVIEDANIKGHKVKIKKEDIGGNRKVKKLSNKAKESSGLSHKELKINKSNIKQEKAVENGPFETISRDRIELAIKLLEDNSIKKKRKVEDRKLAALTRYCSTVGQNTSIPDKCEYVWESSSYVLKNIRSCILTRDWNNLTHMLLFLFGQQKIDYIKQIAKLNFLKNSADIGEECLQEFQDFFNYTLNNSD